jgi:hypothetical protein
LPKMALAGYGNGDGRCGPIKDPVPLG